MSRAGFWTSRLPVLFSLLILLVFAVAVVQIWNFPLRAKQFPLTIGIPMLVLALIQVGIDLFKPTKHEGPAPSMAAGMGMSAMPTELQQQASGGQTQDERARLEQLRHELEELEEEPVAPHTRRDVVVALVWFFSFFLALWLLGFMITVPIYTAVYLLMVSREKWWFSAVGGVAAWLFLWAVFDQIGHLPFFPGQIIQWLGLY